MLPPFGAAHACVAPQMLHLKIGAVVWHRYEQVLGEVIDLDDVDGWAIVNWEYGENLEEDTTVIRVVGPLEALMLGFVSYFG